MSETTAQRKPLLPPKVLKILAVAFGLGLLLFLLLWLDQRNDNDFYRGDEPRADVGEIETLPAPLPPDLAIGDDNASGLRLPAPGQDESAPAPGEQPRIVDEPVAAPVATAPPAPAAPAPAAASLQPPEPVSTPAPRYPSAALRRGIGGTARIRVTVAVDGSVERLELADGSGNRDLDRAALETVRRWRFQPATRNGRPVSAEVVVPIVFNPG